MLKRVGESIRYIGLTRSTSATSRLSPALYQQAIPDPGSGNTRPQSSQLAEPVWTDPGKQSSIGVRELIST